MSRRYHVDKDRVSIDATIQYPYWGRWVHRYSGLRPMRPERERIATTKAGAKDGDHTGDKRRANAGRA